MEDVKKALTVLNNALLTKTFLVGERVTLADISVGCNLVMLYKQVGKYMLFAGWEVLTVKNCDRGHSFSLYRPTLSR